MSRLLLMLCIAVVAQSAPAQTRIAWKLNAGDTFYIEEKISTQHVLKVGVRTTRRNTSQTSVIRVDVKQAKAGAAEIDFRIESLSLSGAGANPSLLRRMQGVVLSASLDKKMQVSRLEGYEEFVQRLAQGNEQLAAVVRGAVSEESLGRAIAQTFAVAPGKPVRPGAKWKSGYESSLGPFGTVKVERDLAYKGPKKVKDATLQQIAISGSASYRPPQDAASELPFEITESDLKFGPLKGTALWDATAGRLVELELNLKLAGPLAIKTAEKQTRVELDQTQSIRVRLLDENPVGEK